MFGFNTPLGKITVHLGIALLVFFSFMNNGCNGGAGNDGTVGNLSCSQSPLQVVSQDNVTSAAIATGPKSQFSNSPNCLGETVQMEGVLKIYDIAAGATENYSYVLEEANGDRHLLQFGNIIPKFQSGDPIQITGAKLSCPVVAGSSALKTVDAIAVISVSGSSHILSASNTAATTGAQSTLVILVNFSDSTNPFKVSDAQNVVFNQLNQFWMEGSFGKTWVTGKALGPYTIASSVSTCDTTTIASQAKAAAQAAGENLSTYSHFVYVFPSDSACGGWIGLGLIGGNPSEAWINGAFDLQTVAHEMGHNLGLYHAHAWNCGTSTLGSSCSSIEYGDPSDAMGDILGVHYSAYHKEQLGWIGAPGTPGVTLVQSSGVYSIEPYETNSTNPKALKILKSNDSGGGHTYYYVEYRQPTGFDSSFTNLSPSNLTSGVLIHYGSDSDPNTSFMLNMSPQVTSWYEAGLAAGQVFTDATAGVSISLDSTTSSGARVSVTVGNTPPPSSNPPPTSGTMGLTVSGTNFQAGQLITLELNSAGNNGQPYTLTITGPNGYRLTKTGTLDSLGNASEKIQVTPCAPAGTYQVSASLTGSTASPAGGQFQVQ